MQIFQLFSYCLCETIPLFHEKIETQIKELPKLALLEVKQKEIIIAKSKLGSYLLMVLSNWITDLIKKTKLELTKMAYFRAKRVIPWLSPGELQEKMGKILTKPIELDNN